MKFQADRDVLLNLLSKAAGTVSNKEVQPILKNFQIKAEGDTLACLSTDMSLGALAEIPLPTITEEGTVCAPAKKLLEMAKTAPAGLMKLELDGKLLAIYTNVKDNDPKKPYQNKWELHCEDGALYPEFPKFDEAKAQTAQRDTFVQGINRVSFAAADSELKINLMGVYVNNGWLYAADGHRAAKMKYDSPLQDIMIPAPAVKMLVSVLRDSQTPEVKVLKTKFHLLFKVGNDIFHTRLLEAQFPDIEKRVFADTPPPGEDPEKAKGLNPSKFFVFRGRLEPDGQGGMDYIPATKHLHCDYYVLDLVHDKFAKAALSAYADACEQEYPLLARDIRSRVAKMGG